MDDLVPGRKTSNWMSQVLVSRLTGNLATGIHMTGFRVNRELGIAASFYGSWQ